MRVLIDTDVLIDLALDRSDHVEAAACLLGLFQTGAAKGFVAWHSLSNFYYLVRPVRGGAAAKDFLMELTEFIDVARTSTGSLRVAARMRLKDFEDAMQVAAAMACRADLIATRNASDFRGSPIPAMLPGRVIKELR